jgi:hypothetical protein
MLVLPVLRLLRLDKLGIINQYKRRIKRKRKAPESFPENTKHLDVDEKTEFKRSKLTIKWYDYQRAVHFGRKEDAKQDLQRLLWAWKNEFPEDLKSIKYLQSLLKPYMKQ